MTMPVAIVTGSTRGIGLAIDAAQRLGLDELAAFRAAFGTFGGCCVAAYAWFLHRRPR